MAAGAAVGASVARANTAVAYDAGVAAGAAAAYPMGAVYPALPAGCAYNPYGSAAYYTCGGAWFKPAYGANGVYYSVVPAP